MANIYEISNELLSIFQDIEDNDGEITSEQEELLTITKETLYSKLNDYNKVIINWKSDVEVVDAEAKRLNKRKQIINNKIERLKKIMLYAVDSFGIDGKSGNKFIELPTVRLFTRGSESVEVDEVRITKLINYILLYIRTMYTESYIPVGSEFDIQGFLNIINANALADWNYDKENGLNTTMEDFIPYTILDLYSINVDITTSTSLYSLLTEEHSILPAYLKYENKFVIRNNTLKEIFKNAINNLSNEDNKLSVAKIIKNKSIQMK